ncbi:MAG: hypothetical protein KGJ88_12165 [Verrucomicrobiota bacterium]|nr:hypothetical protein [Verrucomicrobiota bacterium]
MKTFMKNLFAARYESSVITFAPFAPFPLQRSLVLLALLSAFVLFAAGCGREKAADKNTGKPMSAAEVAAQLQTAFKSADPLIKKEADVAVADIQRDDYPAASNALEKMRAEPHLNFEQDTVVKNALDFLRGSSSGKAQHQSLSR